MKVKNISDPQKLFKKLSECTGSIELVTKEGDRLNLRSKLCQYIVLMNIFNNAKIDELELILSEPSDVVHIMDFLVTGE